MPRRPRLTNFRSVADMAVDTAAWSRTLPEDVGLVVGLPRSGMLAATLLALHMDLPLVDIEGYVQGRVFNGGMRVRSRHGGAAQKALVVDDSVSTGRAIHEARAMVEAAGLADVTIFAAVYALDEDGPVDEWHELVPKPRVFEWNVLHHDRLASWCLEIDGVLCQPASSTRDLHGAWSAASVRDARPLFVPGHEVGWLVTSRPEGLRGETEAWLTEHGIRYRELLMLPDDVENPSAAALARHKASIYRRTRALLFLEGDPRQAARVARASGRSVYCTSTRTMVQPGLAAVAREQVRAAPRDVLGRVSDRLRAM